MNRTFLTISTMKTKKRNKLLTYLAVVSLLTCATGCEKEKKNSTVTDIDGNVYKIVTIGTQVWMTENLRVTHYNDGTPIPNVTDNAEWAALTTSGYCWYDNDEATYKEVYGALYNWHAVNTGMLCPEGWHVPSDAEWDILTEYLGGDTLAGGMLKATGTVETGDGSWYDPNIAAADEYGFSALPGGGHYFNGAFGWMGYYGTYWTATGNSSSNAWTRYMRYDSRRLVRDQYDKKVGYSVRCIKD